MNSTETSKHDTFLAVYSLVGSFLLFVMAILGSLFATPDGIAFLSEHLSLADQIDFQDHLALTNGIGWLAASLILLFHATQKYLKND